MTRPRTVYASSYFEVSVKDTVIVVRRSRAEFPDVQILIDEHRRVIDHLELEPLDRRLVVDVREARGRNDADFESAMAPLRRALLGRFADTRILVRSAVGQLQVARHVRDDGLRARVVTDPVEALADD